MKILNIVDSPLKTKRFRALLSDNTHIDFGLKTGHTYIDHKDKIKRYNYQMRHYNSKREQPYIKNLIVSPALFSYYLLWGQSTSIKTNIKNLNKIIADK